ncbi:hypothetical protein PVAND_005089 [Polypedilum vanderplanki]|uniref:RanBP-type and C3HC4-type zinc finger-containing protein 1 n=1 Tax=Polypedilum vanderplanki TaxID=319348 RepID=A0A9J6C020_POLVA|nr:hypothetical protein PVAND_005089 [Polypedilum vanderplanki]
MNFATADRPRCMLRDDFYPRQRQLPQQQRKYRKFDYYRENNDEFDDDSTWYWNMNQNQSINCNGSSSVNARGSYYNNNNKYYNKPSARNVSSASSERSSTSGFQSFFRWFKRDDKSHRNSKDIRYPRDLTSSTDTLEFEYERRAPPPVQYRKKVKGGYHKNEPTVITPPQQPSNSHFSYTFSQSSSCDSVFSTASSFAFVPPIKYLLNRNHKQIDRQILDNSYTESYHKRVRAREHARENDRNNEVTLRRKYHLYDESDHETNNNISYEQNYNQRNNLRYQDLSLPNTKRYSQESNNLPDSAKLEDLNVASKHRRTSSDSSKDKRAGAFVHVKHKRKAPPPPPLDLSHKSKSLTPKSTGRKKRQAPLPPISPTTKVLEETTSATSLLGDREIRAIIEGNLERNSETISASTPAVPMIETAKESPKMEQRKYVSPYLKIREDRKLTDEQKRILLEQVSKSHQKNDETVNNNHQIISNTQNQASTSTLSIEEGQLVYHSADSPKITKDDKEKVFAPSSPISPRPWYKRSSTNTNHNKETIPFKKEVILRTMEKRKKKDEKDLPEVSYSRNSFFESASKFNIFARLTEDSAKKKEKEAEKRRSQIGIPNISELDREAAEIIQREHEASRAAASLTKNNDIPHIDDDDNEIEESGKSAQELISKFEANSANINRITVNSSFLPREDLFGKKISQNEQKVRKSLESPDRKKVENSPPKSKLPVSINGTKKTNGLMGLWTCPYCTLENPNWKIICEACEKIKPYEKRWNANNEKQASTPPLPRKFSYDNGKIENQWDKKTELVMKYFQPTQNKSNELSKSASETFISNSFLKKSPSPTRRYLGSPKLLPRKMSLEKQETKIEMIAEESNENDNKSSDENKIIVKTIKENDQKSNENEPDLNEIRSARLARFNTSLDMKKNLTEVERSNVTANRKQSPEKKITEKLDFTDPIALEREKERLREKIRAMNAKALAEKYPVLKKEENPSNEISEESKIAPTAPPLSPSNITNTKLGAIKKVLKKPIETQQQQNEIEEQATALEEKIINKEIKVQEQPKREKISTTVQTSVDIKLRKKSEDLVPTTVVELVKKNNNEEKIKKEDDEIPQVTFRFPLNTNTIAINKILRNLENAIADGKHLEAAEFAKDLAKLKVPLSVTRQKDRPKSEVEIEVSKVKAWLSIKENFREMEVNCYEISSNMTIDDLKKQISKDYYIPIEKQKITINGLSCDGRKSLKEIPTKIENGIRINVSVGTSNDEQQIASKKDESESDDEIQNEKVGSFDVAVGGANKNKQKIEDNGWECPLCTLINLPSRQQCLACSTSKPLPNKMTKLKELEYHFKVSEDLKTFFEMDKVDLRPKNLEKNDLNRKSAHRKSSDLLNILEDDKNLQKKEILPQQNTIVMTASIASPNITKNKYRGVDNFSPYKSYIFPKVTTSNNNEISKPIITNVIYKSSQSVTKEPLLSINAQKSHYQELMNLEVSDVVPNTSKFECSICFMEIESKQGVCLRDCLHSFCKICLQSHIKYSEEAEIKCPYIDDTYSCQSFLQEREVRGLVSKDDYEKHLSRSVRLAENKIENAFHCKTPNCKGWCIFEDNTNSFKCPVCTILNCITCGAIHDGLNCKQYQDHLSKGSDEESVNQTKKLLQELIDKDEAMNCPTCHIFLLKKWGCDWLRCSFCKTEICWVTKKKRWGPEGKGDYSDGCKCGFNGKKCSPKCTYCH